MACRTVSVTCSSDAPCLATLAADDNLHPSEKVYTPWADTIVPLAESALLKEKTS